MRPSCWALILGFIISSANSGCSDSAVPVSQMDAAAVDHGAHDGGARDLRQGDAQSDGPSADGKIKLPTGWSKAQPMLHPRAHHTATLLQDGTVLVAGGRYLDDSPYYWGGTDQADRYNPNTDTWQGAGTMPGKHWEHQAILLQDGKVLVIGGFGEDESYTGMLNVGVELYDPANPTTPWRKTGSLLQDRTYHRAVLLHDGRVLVVGGWCNQGSLDSLEIYNPQTDNWSVPAAVLSSPRQLPVVVRLNDNRVLIAGGFDGSQYSDTIDIFDPSTGSITPSNSRLSHALSKATGILLNDGKVLLVGGYCNLELPAECVIKNGEIYDPVLDHLAKINLPYSQIVEHTTTRLADGQVLLVGGLIKPQNAFLYDPGLAAWTQTAAPAAGRKNHAATLLQDGRVLVTGGISYDTVAEDDIYLDTAEIYLP